MFDGFNIVWQQRYAMLSGLGTTMEIAFAGAVLAACLSIFLFLGLINGRRSLRFAAVGFIDGMRCVPFMLFCYLLYYGLPYAGITLDNFTVGIVSLGIYHASYMAELLRGSWKELPKDVVEASTAFGFHGLGRLRMILPPVLITTLPMLGNSMIQIIKDSAFLVIIAVQELTYQADEIQSTYYIPFASFISAVLCYWALCLVVEAGVSTLTRFTAARR